MPASEVIPELRAFSELEVDTSIDYCVQSISCMAMGTIMRELHERLKDGHFRQLPGALDPHKGIFAQLAATDQVVLAEEDPCHRISGLCILTQDRYIMELEQKCHRQRNMLFEADDAFVLEEKKNDILKKKIRDLQSDKTDLEYDLRDLAVAHQREIDDLRDKIADLGSRNHYLDCKVLEL